MGKVDKAIATETRAAAIDPKSQYLKDQIARFKSAKVAGNP
jgi:hypothetical protein